VDPPGFNWTDVHPGLGRKKGLSKRKYEENISLKAPDVFFEGWKFLLKLRASLNGDQRRNMLHFFRKKF
jgi:hypothetical protein